MLYKYGNSSRSLNLINLTAIHIEAGNSYIIIILLSFMKRKKEKCGYMRLPCCLFVGVSPFLNHMTDFYEIGLHIVVLISITMLQFLILHSW